MGKSLETERASVGGLMRGLMFREDPSDAFRGKYRIRQKVEEGHDDDDDELGRLMIWLGGYRSVDKWCDLLCRKDRNDDVGL